jgi:hypothetical protein
LIGQTSRRMSFPPGVTSSSVLSCGMAQDIINHHAYSNEKTNHRVSKFKNVEV